MKHFISWVQQHVAMYDTIDILGSDSSSSWPFALEVTLSLLADALKMDYFLGLCLTNDNKLI